MVNFVIGISVGATGAFAVAAVVRNRYYDPALILLGVLAVVFIWFCTTLAFADSTSLRK